MNDWIPAFVVYVFSYLLGSIPFGLLAGFLLRGVDIRTVGSGNIGATNAARVIGFKWFPVVLLLDALKGFVPTMAARAFAAESALDLMLIAGVGALCGHFFSLYLRFRGGKGVATGLGVVLALTGTPDWPLAAFCALGVFALALAATRMVSLASVIAAWTIPAWYWLFSKPETFTQPWLGRFVFLCLVCAFVTFKHRRNFGRILRGEEPRLGQPKKEPDA